MSAKVVRWVFDHSRAKGNARFVLVAVADYCAADDGTGAFPSVAAIVKKTTLSERTVREMIGALEGLGELEVDRNAGRGGVNTYRVIMHDYDDQAAPLAPVVPIDKAKPAKENRHAVADELTAKFWEHHKSRLTQSFIAVRGVVRTAISNGNDRDNLARALDKVAREGRPVSGGTLAFALREINGKSNSSGHQPYRNPEDPSAYHRRIRAGMGAKRDAH